MRQIALLCAMIDFDGLMRPISNVVLAERGLGFNLISELSSQQHLVELANRQQTTQCALDASYVCSGELV